ncbi:hypothetical protein ACI3PL_00420 [Lacticaseibacillus paracasei]|jgi:hypothetical protein|nr:hypothetical protein Lpp46_2566 [Lacticaseibacillus paracasei subsp. paracasei Lpp46]
MSNETKRDVFEAVWNRLAGYQVFFNGWPRESLYDYKKRYDTALPDDLPVIPKEVGEWLTWCKERGHSLKDALGGETRVSEDTFASAWLLGVWRVEETGEIVKLEAEK